MARIKKYGETLKQNLKNYQTFVTDTNPNSDYFRITEFKDTFTGGKNGFLIEGSQYLQETTEIKIQILDVEGNSIYWEPGAGSPEYYEGVSKPIAVHIYEDTPIGLGNITILAELKQYIDETGVERDIPDEWKGVYNVKWEKDFKINKNLQNEDKVRFYRIPKVDITEIVKPIFSNVVTSVTQTGNVHGIPLVPNQGTKLVDYTLPTSYLLTLNDGTAWTGSVIGNNISIPSLGYTAKPTDVLNDSQLVVSNPYTVSGLVSSFTSASFTTTFNYVEGVDNLATALTGSFAKINLNDLTTFIGDVARVKVFRKSQSDLSDYQFIQEVQLESNELLIDLESTTKNQEYYGLFDSNIITEYWLTSSNDITPTFNQNFLYNSVKLSNTGTNFYFTSKSLDITEGIEYTLDLNVRKTNNEVGAYLKAFISGSRQSMVNGSPTTIQIQQTIVNISSDNSVLQKTNSSNNIVAEQIDSASLYFEVVGDNWHISDVSLRASQESSFSPDEITFIQPIPRTLPTETFDFLFQFYDINNNYIPIVVEESKTFDGGNLNRINKSIELIPSSLYFAFDSASNGGNPIPPTTIFIDVVKNFLTGSTNFTSRSFDFFNNELSSSQYVGGVFPGKLEDTDLDTVRLTVEAFTGSVAPADPPIIVQFIEYTAECEGVEDSIIISRVQDGKGGVNYEIRPYNGTVIRNSDASSSLEVQAIRIDGINEIKLRDGLDDNQSDTQLFIQSGSTYITLAEASSSGFVRGLSAGLTGSGEINYNAIFNRDSIDGQRTVYLIPSSSNNYSASILTALTLTDLQDGLDAGVVLFDAENFTINPRTQTLFTPTFSSATASFYRRGTTEAPISCSFEIYPSMSINADFVPEYWMYFITHSCDPDISVIAYDEFGNEIPSLPIGAYTGLAVSQSKQVLTSFTYTEPFTSASVNVDKLFTIIPEGKPGDESIVFEVNPQNVSLNANPRGIVADYSSTTLDIKLKQGARYLSYSASQEPGTFNIAQQNIIGRNITQGYVALHGDYTASLRVSASSTMTDLSGSIEFPLEIRPYYTSSVYTASAFQYLTKVLDGPPPIEFIFSPQNAILQADEVSYVSDYAASDTDIQVKEGDDYLTFTTQSNVPGTWRILSVTTNNIQTGSLSSSSFDNATLTFNRFDYPYVSASAVYSIKVNPYSLGPGHQYTSSIYTRTQTFTKNVAPPNARAVSLTSTAETVTFDGDGVVITPTGDIRLTAQAFNTTGSVYYQFFRDGSPYSAIQSDDFYDISSGDAVNPGEIATWRVDIRDGNSSAGADVRAQAQVTIAGIQAGAEAYSVILTNENSSISADLWDVTLTGTGNTISAFKGTTQLTHTNSFSPKTQDLLGNDIGSLGEYQVTIHSVSGHLTPGSSLVSASILTTVGSSAVIGDLAGWTTPGLNQSGEIVYRVDIENGRQTFFKTQSFGVNIEAAAPYTVELSNQNAAVVYKVSGQLTTDGTGTTIRAFRGGTELTNSSASFSTPQTDIYGNTGYKNQYRATVYSVPAYVDLNGSTVSGSYLTSNPAQIGTIDAWTDPVTNLTGEVIYQIELEGRETILKSQNFGIQLEGETGPGIVMRGQWDEVTNYIGSVETTNNRRDAVIYPDPSGSNGETHYFMALSGSGPGALDGNGVAVGPQVPPSPSNDTDYWQYLGQQDLFVAAKMAIFEESFVKNTINVGNNPGSSFANIVLSGGRTDPYLAIGQGGTQGATGTSGFSVTGSNIIGYDQPGIFLGMFENGAAGTTGRFSIKSAGGTAGTRGLFWDGDALYIIGAIRQVQPGQNEGGLRGLWSSGLVYYPDDIVTYQDQTWVMTGATHTSTNDSNALTGVPGSGPWTLGAAAGTSGTNGPAGTSGAAAKTVALTAENYVIAYDANGSNPSPSGTIKLIASSSNFTDGYFKFTGGGTNFSDEATFTDGTDSNNDSATLTIPSSYFTGPLTFRVGVADGDQVELANDSLSIIAVKPGADVSPQYMIAPVAGGTQIKNGSGNITLQVRSSDSTGLTDITSGTDARLYKSDSSLLAVSMSGITDAGNGVAYNPTIGPDAIDGTLILELRDNSDSVLDTITLVDVTDGLGGGSFLAPSMQMTRTNGTTTYTPPFLSATASFFSTDGTEYTSEFRIFASASGVTEYTDNMYFDEGNQDANISYTANNGDGVNFSGPGFANSLATKDVNIVATFTDPNTGQTTTANETFYVVSDGADGIDAITVVAANTAHTLPAGSNGVVSDYTDSGIDILVYEGTSSLSYDGVGTSAQTWKIGTPYVNPAAGITVGSITDGGDNAVVGDHSSMDNSYSLVTITYPITGSRKNGDQFLTQVVQSITKAVAGINAKGLRISADSQIFAFDDSNDTTAADDTIRIYIDQQNLSGTVATTDITITPTGQSAFNPSTLTGTVTSGTGQQYFDVTFSSTFAADKTRLPVTISVTKDSITDIVSIFKVEGGADTSPMYMITSIAGGTQIKNGSGTIELQVQKSDVSGLTDVTSGTDARIYDGATLLAAQTGVTDGGNGVAFNPIIAASFINGTKTLLLKDGSLNVLDSITLVDVSDGLGGGSFLSPTMNTTRQNGATTYTPTFLSATASFFDTSGTEYTKAVRLYPTYSAGVDNFYYENNAGPHNDSEIVLTLDDGDGTSFAGTGAGNLLPTKDVNITAVFTDPATSQTNTITETFYIVSDGADGVDALTIISTNQTHNFAASSQGVVGDYSDSGTEITVYEGTASLSYDGVGTSDGTWKIGTPYVNPAASITVGSISDNGDTALVGDHSSMDNSTSQLSITYPITGSRLNGSEFKISTTQTITKANQGVDAKVLSLTSDAQVFVFDDADDNKAADDTIRVYINQQNLSGDVVRTDITITDALAGSLIVPWLTGSVSSGTGEQYFDLYFNTGSSAVGYIDSKTKLPVTITVQKDSITDSTTLSKLEGGASNAPMYFIAPQNGTQIKNGQGSLEFKILESAPGAISEVSSGNIKIYSGSNLITTYGGVSGTDYNPTISAAAVYGSMTLILKDGSTTYDSLALIDVTDGLGGGSFLASALNTIRQSDNSYLPTYLNATASFYDTNGTEYTKAWRITPNLDSGTDYMYYDNDSGAHTDSEITFTINDGDGTDYSGTGIGNKLPTKDLNIVATFTDPNTGQANTITETFYIVSDGADGLDAITVISTNQAHTAPASTLGVVSSYLGSGTTISVYEGITQLNYDGTGTSDGTWTVSTTVAPTSGISVGSISISSNNALVADHSSMDNAQDVVTITYNITGKRSNGSSFTASSTQTITKAKIGATGAAGTQGDAGSPGAGVVYRGEFASTTSYFHTTTRRDVVRYAANYYLTSDTGFNSSAGSDWGTPGASTKWESFGAQFSSVATDILLAQDVYADRTVNVGADGPNPVIQLYADYPTNANPSIKLNLGTQGYAGTNGIFIGFDSSTPKLSLVNTDNTKYVKWTGSDLEVKGTINADAGVIGGFAITSNAISSSNNKLILRDNGEITGSAIYLTSGSMAGWTAQPNGLSFYESVVTGYTNQTSTTVTSSIANVFPTYLLASSSVVTPTITIPNSGTSYNISTRVDSDEITISTAIYKTPSTFLLSFMSSSYQGPALSTIEDTTYPGSWRTDYNNKFYAAASETWEFDWIIDKDTSPANYPGLNNASANVGYSMLTVYADDIERVLGFTDAQINNLIGKGFIRRDNPVDIADLGEGYPILQIVDSYDVNNYPGPGPLYGTTLSTDAFDARSFRVVDILNSTDYDADTDYDTFVLGVEVDSDTYPFEQFSTDWSTNTTLGTIRAGEHWDGVDASQPSLFNTVTLYVPEYVQRNSTTYYGGATVSAGSIQPVIGQIEAVKIASSGSGGSSKPYISMGQLTQSYDESGIFMGYSSGSTAERLSLKSYDGQKYFRWTGTNVELSGTVTAADGNIGGFVIGSDSIHDSGNNLILQSSGQITGSNIYLSKVYSGTEYPILDTANGIIDAKNNGRAVGFSTDEFSVTQANPTAGTEYLANAANTFTFVWQGLQYENKLFLGYQEKVIRANTGSPGSSRPLANLRVKLYYHQTASNASGTAGYDSWVSIQNTSLGDNVGATSLSFGPDTYSLAANGPESIVIDIPEAHQTKQLKLEVLPRFAMLGSPTNTTVTTYVKNVSITTGRDLANTWTVVGEAPSFPTPPI